MPALLVVLRPFRGLKTFTMCRVINGCYLVDPASSHMLRPSEEGPRYQNAKGARLALLVMFLDTLLFDWPCKNGRTCVEFCGEVATRTALLLHTHSMRCVARLLKGCAQNSNVHLRSCDFALFGRKIKINRGARRTHI